MSGGQTRKTKDSGKWGSGFISGGPRAYSLLKKTILNQPAEHDNRTENM